MSTPVSESGPFGPAIVDHDWTPLANPRHDACARCHFPRNRHPQPDRDRDLGDEQRLAGIVALAREDHGLFDFAWSRALPGPVKDWQPRDFPLDIAEELADAANYALWDAQKQEQAGESDRWVADLQFLAKLCEAWQALQYRRNLG